MQALVRDNRQEAMLYEKQRDNRVLCQLSPYRCLIEEGRRGICQVRENRDGTLYTLVYRQTTVQNVDTIEKSRCSISSLARRRTL
jgi:pyruvate formate lyase activating enzyme